MRPMTHDDIEDDLAAAREAVRERDEKIERLEEQLSIARGARDFHQMRAEYFEKDAARYRWVRTAGAFDSEIGLNILSDTPEKYDAKVDEMRGAK